MSEGPLTRQQIMDICKSLTYKPSWTVSCMTSTGDRIAIYMSRPEPDADDPSKTTTVFGFYEFMPGMWYSEEQVRNTLAWWVRDMEQHEVDEWLRFGGERYKEPHPKVLTSA